MTQGVLKVGEVVIGVGFVTATKRNGMEGVVIQDCGIEDTICIDTGEYLGENHLLLIKWQDGEEFNAIRHNLKRKKPPEQKKFSGEEMVFDLFKCKQQSNLKILEECI